MKSLNELETESAASFTEETESKELALLKQFFSNYLAKFVYSPHLPEELFLETDISLRNLNVEQKGHLFSCKDCLSKFFPLEVLSEFFETFTPQNRWNSSVETLLQNEGKHITNTETNMEDKGFMTSIDGVRCVVEKSELTGAEIMDLAGIPRQNGLIMVLEDGTQVQVKEDEVIELKEGRRFKTAPRFMRG